MLAGFVLLGGVVAVPLVSGVPERMGLLVAGETLLPESEWPMSVASPSLDDPLEIVLTSTTNTSEVDDFDKVGCDGVLYRVQVPSGRDARVTMDPKMGALRYPVWITGGRNVHVLGLEMRPVVQPGCEIGEAHQVKDPSQPNIHPRLVGNKVLRLQQSGTTFVEGVDIDLDGMEGDCIVLRNPNDMGVEAALEEREVVIVNTRCTGIEGLDKSSIGDGVHGDFLQNQGEDDIGTLIVENVSILTSSNGITLHNWSGSENRPRLLRLRNIDYAWDPRYAADDEHEISGLVFTASAVKAELENVWVDDPRGLNYGILNKQRIGAIFQSGHIEQHPAFKSGRPAGGFHAPAERTGVEYVSPY